MNEKGVAGGACVDSRSYAWVELGVFYKRGRAGGFSRPREVRLYYVVGGGLGSEARGVDGSV